MSEHDGTQSPTKQRKSRKGNTVDQENGKQALAAQLPTNDAKEAWKAHWKAQGQYWRTEPEIDSERQKYLTERRAIVPDIEQGIYPFKEIKLSRADIEWLLVTHENGRGPVDWSDDSQRERVGLDLRGANLCQEDLSGLPLARMHGGLTYDEDFLKTDEQRIRAGMFMEGTRLYQAQLQGAYLCRVQLQHADLGWTQLQHADLYEAQLQGANLREARLQGANLRRAQLQGARLYQAQLQGAYLREAQLQGAYLREAHLEDAKLNDISLCDQKNGSAFLADVSLNDTNLAVINWKPMKMLGDEQRACETKQIVDYQTAVRANRQLAVALQEQGINEDAARFAYRAQKLQRVILRKQRKFGSYLFSLFLDLLAGYGYRPGRSVFWYLVIIAGFATAYYSFGHITPLEAFILSLTSFHGRGFFPGTNITLSDTRVILAAFEAVIGLFIEISFIATFTKRFFGS